MMNIGQNHLMTTEQALIRIEPMQDDDIPEVSRVERLCFTNPWPSSAYRREIANAAHNAYLVLREYPGPEDDADDNGGNAGLSSPWRTFGRNPWRTIGRRVGERGRIIGFAGLWHMFEEAHITTIGVEPGHRGQGLGEFLLMALFDEAIRRDATWLTLEVRVSNEVAQTLYRKYGFTIQGTRKRYYSDNNEDAYIMWSPSLKESETIAMLGRLRAQVGGRHELPGAVPAVFDAAGHRDGAPDGTTS